MPNHPKCVCPSCGAEIEARRNPYPTVDLIVTRDDSILLIERRNPPHGWALPGGFVDYGETVERAAARELAEETGLIATDLKLLGVWSDPDRDPRQHNLSVVFIAETEGEIQAGDDATAARWFRLDDLPEALCFDHAGIIDAFRRQRFGAGGAKVVPIL
ncbi:MAG: NUDIX hydrolase [Geothermobacteraceae bacterium]